MKGYKLQQVESMKGGINFHRTWIDMVSGQEIHSNEGVLGNKFYMTNGEGIHTVWYESPTTAIKAFLKLGQKAIRSNV